MNNFLIPICKLELDQLRELFWEEFQILDKGRTGEITLNEIKGLFTLNGIPLEEKDFALLKEEDIIVSRQNRLYVRYPRFLQVIIPDSNPIDANIQQNAALKLIHFIKNWRRKRELKLRKEAEEEEDVGARKSSKGRKTKKSPPKKATKRPQAVAKGDEPSGTKPKELFEMESKRKPLSDKAQTQASRPASTRTRPGTSKSPGKGKKKPQIETVQEPPLDPREKERRDRIATFCRGLIDNILDQVTKRGDSAILTKEIQSRFQSRPVTKDVFVTMQELELEVLDLLPRSLNFSTQTGRLCYMDKEGKFFEYDVPNKQKLKPISLASKVPLKKSKVIDFFFDDKSGRMYILTDSWMLEVWEIHQELSVPVSRVKIIADEENKYGFMTAYLKRYMDVFPTFVTLSKSSHQLLVINCTSVNNSIVLVDPVSLSVLTQSFLRQEDYKISPNLSKTIFALKPHIEQMQKNQVSFEKLFEGYLIAKKNDLFVIEEDFVKVLSSVFEMPEATQDDCKLIQ